MKKHVFDTPAGCTFDVDELLERAEKEVDRRDPQSLMALAGPLYCLAQNKSLLQKYINLGLSQWEKGLFHFYSSQSCQIASLGGFGIRVNLWPLLPSDPRRRAILADVLSYFDFHDHNFSFITANYSGPGYETELYSYRRDRIVGYPGEKLELDYQGRHCLDNKTVMLYQEFYDVHSQLPPTSPSSSINLIMTAESSGLTNQLFFNPHEGRISGYVGSFSHKRVNAIGFARHFHNEETLALLEQVLESHECSRTRVEAAQVLVSLRGESALSEKNKKRLLRDPLAQALWSMDIRAETSPENGPGDKAHATN
jgi:hypothetical protein